MKILVTNDDGINAPGIKALARAFRALGDVIVVAPDSEKSASGHALTLQHPLRIHQVGEGEYATTGTPTDCVLLAVHALLEGKHPDLVVSGVNTGPNMGDDVTYSGTVSAAFEGTLLGIPSMAISLATFDPVPYDPAADIALRIAKRFLERGLPPKTLLNVNVPPGALGSHKGVRLTKLGHRVFTDIIAPRVDPRGKPYYWVAGTAKWAPEAGTDIEAIQQGYVSVTPLNMDMTDFKLLAELEAWGLES
ncbi:MAG TPA: 5'/3'-nucleotidase SurE [Candidatus Eisenbacteria bacterium]